MRVEVAGDPPPQVIAAIVAAVEAAWPQPQPVTDKPAVPTTWRHADRWWNQGRLPSTWQTRGF